MRYERRLSRLEAHSDASAKRAGSALYQFRQSRRNPKADFVKLDDEGISLRRRSDETVEQFMERVREEVRLTDEQSNIPRRAPVRVIVLQCDSETSTN